MSTSRHVQRIKKSTAAQQRLIRSVLLASNLQQSVLAELDNGSAELFAYSPYGSQRNSRHAGTQLAFNGQLKEPATGWYQLGNGYRAYNTSLMRFYSADRLSPFGKGGVNAYAYCGGDPVNFQDPSGQFISAIGRFIGAFETIAGHVENISAAIFRSRPRGVLGFASATSNVGYAGVATGAAMQAAGYSGGIVVSNVGAALVSVGNGIRAASGVTRVLKETRFVKAIAQRLVVKSPAMGELSQVIVDGLPTDKVLSRIQTPAKNLNSVVSEIRTA